MTVGVGERLSRRPEEGVAQRAGELRRGADDSLRKRGASGAELRVLAEAV